MARIAKRLCPETTWTIIDLPSMLRIQKWYAGTEGMTPWDADGHFFGKIDVFVATCSLDESPAEAQDWAMGTDWLCAPRVLTAFQFHPLFADSDRFASIASTDLWVFESLVPGLFFGVR
jgi:hypothetical protein